MIKVNLDADMLKVLKRLETQFNFNQHVGAILFYAGAPDSASLFKLSKSAMQGMKI